MRAVEYFEPATKRAVFIAFLVLGLDGNEEFRISLGSYDITTEVARR